MKERALYSIKEARELLGGISRNSIYSLMRDGSLPSVVLGCRRFISGWRPHIATRVPQAHALDELFRVFHVPRCDEARRAAPAP